MKKFINSIKKSKSIQQKDETQPSSEQSTDSYCSNITFTRKWTIANFSRLYEEGYPWKWRICSGKFSPPENEELEFKLIFYPKGSHGQKPIRPCPIGEIDVPIWTDYISVGVLINDIPRIYNNGTIKCGWKVWIEDANRDQYGTGEMPSYALVVGCFTIASDFVKHSHLSKCATKYLPQDQLTIHFEIHLQAVQPIFNVITNNVVGTSRFDCAKVKVTKIEHTWTVENFTRLYDEGSIVLYFIQSDHFSESERFCMKLHPNADNDNLKICLWNDNRNAATIYGRISILDVDGEECYKQELTRKIDSNNAKCFTFNRASLLDNSRGLVQDNKLRIYCEMSYMMDSIEDKKFTDSLQISNSELKSESITDVTHKTVHYLSHNWTIDNFSGQCLATPTYHWIDSPVFEHPIDTRYKFYLFLTAKNDRENYSQDHISFELFNVSNLEQVTVQYQISLMSADGDKLIKWCSDSTLRNGCQVGVSKFIAQSSLQNSSFIKQYLPDDKLTISCEIWILEDRKKYKTKPTITDNQSLLVNSPSGTATVNMSNSNFQGAIVNVQGILNLKDFAVNSSSIDKEL